MFFFIVEFRLYKSQFKDIKNVRKIWKNFLQKHWCANIKLQSVANELQIACNFSHFKSYLTVDLFKQIGVFLVEKWLRYGENGTAYFHALFSKIFS